jgi:hypothetical protein
MDAIILKTKYGTRIVSVKPHGNKINRKRALQTQKETGGFLKWLLLA